MKGLHVLSCLFLCWFIFRWGSDVADAHDSAHAEVRQLRLELQAVVEGPKSRDSQLRDEVRELIKETQGWRTEIIIEVSPATLKLQI